MKRVAVTATRSSRISSRGDGMFLIYLIVRAIDIYVILLIVRAVISWFSPDPYNHLYLLLVSVTEPVLKPFRDLQRRYFPHSMFDFSVFLAIILLTMIRNFFIGVI